MSADVQTLKYFCSSDGNISRFNISYLNPGKHSEQIDPILKLPQCHSMHSNAISSIASARGQWGRDMAVPYRPNEGPMTAGCLHTATPGKDPRLREAMERDWPRKGKEVVPSVHAVSKKGRRWVGNGPRSR